MKSETDESAFIDGMGSARARRVIWTWTALVVALVVAGFAAWQLSRSGTDPSSLSRAYGFDIGNYPAISEERSELAPALTGPKLSGGSLSLADYRGKVVVVNLWASWCGPCRREQPELERVWREYRDRGVQFLGLNVRDQQAAARAFQDEFDVSYPSFFDDSSRLAFELKAQVLPTTYVIDRDGKVAFRLTGTVDGLLLRSVLDAALGKEGARG
ncbi:MAG TPA: TlpA disulfide reductase family protein [Actinomycetota bacterium]